MGTGNYLREEYLYRPAPLHVSSIGRFSALRNALSFGGTPSFTSTGYPANNLAFYMPLNIPTSFTIARFMIANGNNATGNVDIGLYSSSGTRLMSTGTTARAGTTVIQYIAVTDRTFPPGNYYIALVGSSTTGTYSSAVFDATGSIGIGEIRGCGALQEALGSTVLPASMTPAAYSVSNVFWFGFTQSDTL